MTFECDHQDNPDLLHARLPEALCVALKAIAKDEVRDFNSQLVYLLKRSTAQYPAQLPRVCMEAAGQQQIASTYRLPASLYATINVSARKSGQSVDQEVAARLWQAVKELKNPVLANSILWPQVDEAIYNVLESGPLELSDYLLALREAQFNYNNQMLVST
tara:strand:+ start:17716 stop:18198 length:483 start_codon:yes stop_codon:yes gene_type:complete